MDQRVNSRDAHKSGTRLRFKPRKMPRMIIGKENRIVAGMDLEVYNKHRLRVFKATATIDNKPPHLSPYNYINFRKIKDDVQRLMQIDKDNRQLLCRINLISRTPAKIDCWKSLKPIKFASLRMRQDRAQAIASKNQQIYKSLVSVKSRYDKETLREHWSVYIDWFQKFIKLPQVLHIKQPLDTLVNASASITEGLININTIPRPKVFLEFTIKDFRPLGRVIIELYLDYANGSTTQSFLNNCSSNAATTYHQCRVNYAEKCKFFAVGQPCDNRNRVFDAPFKAQPNNLRHNRMGVVSAVPYQRKDRFKKGIKPKIWQKNPITAENNSSFSITLSPMPEWDGRRTVIGKVIKGNEVLCKINDMLRKCGGPLVPIIVSDCGVIPFTKKELALVEGFDDGSAVLDSCASTMF